MFLPAQAIRELCLRDPPLIAPFSERTAFAGTTYGIGPASYDLRIDRNIELWRGHSVRADAIEYICMPDYLIGLIFSKSTWARVHIEHAGTVVDPGFSGVLRLEINMHDGDEVIRIIRGSGIAQILFAPLTAATTEPYRGKYSNQLSNQDALFVS